MEELECDICEKGVIDLEFCRQCGTIYCSAICCMADFMNGHLNVCKEKQIVIQQRRNQRKLGLIRKN
jgi:hypothetical protein